MAGSTGSMDSDSVARWVGVVELTHIDAPPMQLRENTPQEESEGERGKSGNGFIMRRRCMTSDSPTSVR
jgi:hypothetical protein